MDLTNNKIFVSIASFIDEECFFTLKDLYDKAFLPDRIYVGLCIQDYKICIVLRRFLLEKAKHIKYDFYSPGESGGASWARAIALSFKTDQEYVLQIDSHMRFARNWDSMLIELINGCNSPKSIISTYPNNYTPINELSDGYFNIMIPYKFGVYNNLEFIGIPKLFDSSYPTLIKRTYLCGCFIFSRSLFHDEVFPDKNIYQTDEELILSLRAWTFGWKIYCPTKTIIYHYWKRGKKNRHYTINNSAVRSMLISKELTSKYLHESVSGKFVGNINSVKDFIKLSMIDFESHLISPLARF